MVLTSVTGEHLARVPHFVKIPMETAVNELAERERNLNSLATVTISVTLVAVTMTFGALIFVFLWRALSGEFWSHIQLPTILWLSTALLIASSIVFEIARKPLASGDIEKFHRLTLAAMLIGVAFLLSQIAAGYQILSSGIVMRDNAHPWFVFLFGGLHGLHIIAGLIGLFVLYRRTREPVSGPRYQIATRVGARAVAIFWHYMDFMWLVLFSLLIFWRR